MFSNKDKRLFFFFILTISNMIFFAVMMIALYKLLCSIDLTLLSTIDTIRKVRFSVYEFFSEFYTENLTFLFSCNTMSIYSSNIYVYVSFLESGYIPICCKYIYNTVIYPSIIVSDSDSVFYIFGQDSLILYSKTLIVRFFSKTHSFDFLDFSFYSLQDKVIVFGNSTTLVFFRIVNKMNYDVSCMVIFLVSPANVIFEFNKLQCFCFEDLLITKGEAVELPVIFRIQQKSLVFLATRPKLLFFYLLIEK